MHHSFIHSFIQQQTVWALMFDLRTNDSYEQILFNESVQKFHKTASAWVQTAWL